MKLGSETGSLVNHLMSSSSNTEPNIGTPATLLSWTDRSAATVTKVFEKNGEWCCVRKNEDTGRWVESGRGGILLGRRETYFDPSF